VSNYWKKIPVIVVVMLFVIAAHEVASACPLCYGDPDSQETQGMNMAIISLLGITGAVLSGFAAFFVFLRRRARSLNRRFVHRLN
jgi:hypothetical protein